MLLSRVLRSGPLWEDHMYHELSDKLAKYAIEYMRPLMHVRSVPNTGALENSLHADVQMDGMGFEIGFLGLFYGLYVDTGNDNLGTAYASTYGLKAFPIDRRLGSKYYNPRPVIHPMGTATPNSPTHYSDATMQHMANESAADMALRAMESFLMELVTV